MTARSLRRLIFVGVASCLALLAPLAVVAHPLGNFTINHYAGLRIAADRIRVDVVIDQAEIPTFQERQRIDTNGDGQVSDAELAAERRAACPRLAQSLALSRDGAPLSLSIDAAGLSFPAGAGGLPTMRLVCEFSAALASPITEATTIRFADRSSVERIGWREIVVEGDGASVSAGYPTASVSARLSAYPQDLLATPLNMAAAEVVVRPGGAMLPAWTAPDAEPLTDVAGGVATRPASGAGGAVPGGVAAEISGLLGSTDLTPVVLILSLLAAAVLGAGHAITPGHGKTIMAAYLVGTRGGARHALGLGLATAVSHTIGVLILAGLIIVAGTALPADRVYPILTTVSALIVVAIGAWLLAAQIRRWAGARSRAATSGLRARELMPASAMQGGVALLPGATHARDHSHEDGHHHPHDHAALFAGSATMSHEHTHETVSTAGSTHRHGWRTHDHGAADGTSLSWRGLVALGLSGGLVPSTNALIILVATVAAGRPAYGFVLVIAFGLGMASVLVGVGLAMVYAAGWIGRSSRAVPVARVLELAPVAGAVAVLLLGLYLTGQAIAGTPVL